MRDPTGVALVIPTWMLAPAAAAIQLAPQAVVSARALCAVALLVKDHLLRPSDASLSETGRAPDIGRCA